MTNDNELITRYSGLARSIARRYPLPDGWAREDIEQEAMIGLWNATKRYDPDGLHAGYPFPTVAAFAIRTQIRKALRQATGIDAPEIDTAPDIAEQPTMPLPRPITPAWLQDRITRPLPIIELTAETPDPAPSVEEQVIAVVDGAQVSATLEAALLLLSERQRTIIERRYGLSGDGVCWTQQEVGQLFGVTQQAVSMAQRKALATLRAHLGATPDGELVLIQLNERRSKRVRTRAA